MQADFGEGTWTAELAEPISGDRLELDPSGWEATANRTPNQPSTAELRIDPDYASFLRRQPVEWENEIVLARDGFEQWVGPVTGVGEDEEGVVVWSASDRMAIALHRRIWWHTFTLTDRADKLFEVMLDAADYGDPLGLRRDPRPNGLVTTISPVVGDRLIRVLETLATVLEWTVVGDTIRYGNINVDTELLLPDEAWSSARPLIQTDGMARLSHVVGITDAGRVFYPSADPYDRPAGTKFLVDTVQLGAVSLAEAGRIVERLWKTRQLSTFIDPDARLQLGPQFPLSFDQVVPGAVMAAATAGNGVHANDLRIRVQEFQFEAANNLDVEATASFVEAPESATTTPLALVDGVIVPAGLVGDAVLADDLRDLSVPAAAADPPTFPPALPPLVVDPDDTTTLPTKPVATFTREAEAVFSQDGAIVVDTSGRYLVDLNGRIVRASITAGSLPPADTDIQILKNGNVIHTLTLPTTLTARYYNLGLPIAFGDMLQAHAPTATGAIDVVVKLQLKEFPPPPPTIA